MAAHDDTDRARVDHVGRDLLVANRDFQARALGELRRRGHDDLTPALVGLIPHLDRAGTRVTQLAERAATTKQAAGQLVGELERLGDVRKEPDPTDRRASLVVFTDRGDALLADVLAAIAGVESRYAAVLGDRDLATLRRLLGRITAGGGEADGTVGLPG